MNMSGSFLLQDYPLPCKIDKYYKLNRKQRMPNDDAIEVMGTVVKVLPATMYRVRLENGHELLAHVSGRMRKHFIKITTGDKVTLEISPYDLTKGRITYRHKA